jgi:NTP pyrophosphatase (non-canonical NTP hydrolase)
MPSKFYIGADEWPGLSKLIEECGEVLQIVGKLIAVDGDVSAPHWDRQDLKESLENELADLMAAIDFIGDHCEIDTARISNRAEVKRALFEKWHQEDKTVESRR